MTKWLVMYLENDRHIGHLFTDAGRAIDLLFKLRNRRINYSIIYGVDELYED